MLSVNRLSRAEAHILIAGAVQHSQKMRVDMCIAICDESGHLIAFERMDGGKISSIPIAIDKAYTAAVARKPTHVYGELCQPGKPTWGIHVTNEGHFSIIGGGVPVTVEGTIVGGIGVSSGTAIEDREVAEAALNHFHATSGLKA